MYDDYSNTVASSGAFQDRSQNNIVHKLTHISDDPNVSAGEVTVAYNTGARNTYIKEIIYKGRGRCVTSFGLDVVTEKQAFRIDKIKAYQEKFCPLLVQMYEDFDLTIGEINVFPSDASESYYGAGGSSYFLLRGENASLTIEKMNLWFNASNLPALTQSGDYLVNLTGNMGSFSCNLHVYTNANTYNKIEKAFFGVRAPTTPYSMKSSVIHWTAHVTEWDSSMTKDATIYGDGEILGDKALKYTYTVLGDGIPRAGSALTEVQTIFEVGATMYTFNPLAFGLRYSNGHSADLETKVLIRGDALTTSISEITPPLYEGQTLAITSVPRLNGILRNPITIAAGAVGTELAVDRIVAVGETITATAYEDNGSIAWHIPT